MIIDKNDDTLKKKELTHFQIGRFYGGSQQWMLDPWMRLGGCGALAALDSCIFFARHWKIKKMIPQSSRMDKGIYRQYAQEMKPYLSPRFQGINRLSIYVEGFQQYLKDREVHCLRMKEYPMGTSTQEAWEVFCRQIDQGYLVPVLLLNPVSKEWKDWHWHWFLLNGYQINEEGECYVKAVTYGAYEWLPWDGFWDSDDKDNGGMILYSIVQ